MKLTRRNFTQYLGLGMIGAVAADISPVFAADAGMIGTDDPLQFVAPELRPAVRAMLSRPQLIFSPSTLAGIQENNRKIMASDMAFLPNPPVALHRVPAASALGDVSVYVINSSPDANRPAILYMHGGGWIAGSAKNQVPRFQQLAAQLDCTIVSIEYHLAPQALYDTAIEEMYACLKWLYTNADTLGVDPRRIAIMGESAGGAHAATLAFTARDRGEVPVLFQLLVYPALDDRTASAGEVPFPLGAVGWGAESHRYAWGCYLGMPPGTDNSPIAAIPGRRTDLKGLPPTWIGVGGIDLLAPENIDYARRLTEAGVPTELHLVPGAYHGFDKAAGDIGIVKRFNEAKIVALRRAFDRPTA